MKPALDQRLFKTANDKLINQMASAAIIGGTSLAVLLPFIAALVLVFFFDNGLLNLHWIAALMTVISLCVYFVLTITYLVRFETVIDSVAISSKAGTLATFWAGYAAGYATLISSIFSSTGMTADAWHFLAWFSVSFVPILACVTQALVPEAFWNLSTRWHTKMLAGATFMIFLQVSLSMISTLVILSTSYLLG